MSADESRSVDNTDEETLLFVWGDQFAFVQGNKLDKSKAKAFLEGKKQQKQEKKDDVFKQLPLFPTKEVPKKAPKAQFKSLDDVAAIKKQCFKKKMCVFLHGKEVFVKEVAKKFKRDPFVFFATEDKTLFTKFLQAFLEKNTETNVGMFVLKPGKQLKFVTREASDENSVSSELEKILEGTSKFAKLSKTKDAFEKRLEEEATSKEEKDAEATHEEL
jgi:hypothetical protein